MIKKEFKTKIEANLYLSELKINREKGYLTVSEKQKY